MNRTMDIYIRNLHSGEEIDAMIADKLFGLKFVKPTHGNCCTCQTCGWSLDECICGYSQYTEKMWDVVEKMISIGGTMTLVIKPNKLYNCTFAKADYGENYVDFFASAEAESAPLAVCRAALLALMSKS